MADIDSEVRGIAQEIQRDILKEYRAKRDKMTGTEKGSMLAELSAFNRTVEATATGAAYPFFSPTALVSALGNGQLASLQEQSAP